MSKIVTGAVLAAAVLALSACSNSEQASPNTGNSAPAPTTTTTSAAASAKSGVTTPADVFGPACGQLPQGNAPGGLTAMGPQPVASTDNLTVFAPADPAFAALGDAKFAELAANPNMLGPILQYHVVPKRYDASGLAAAKSVKSLNASAGDLKIEGSGTDLTVNGAKILCGNIPTRNATVFVIDKVMLPAA